MNSHDDYEVFIKKLDKYQQVYYKSLFENPVTCCDAKAGTGKTTIAVMAGLQMLERGDVGQFIYVRFPDPRMQSLGALPGELEVKEDPYMGPFYDACAELGMSRELTTYKFKQVTLCTNVKFRGINIQNSFIIIDEAQNGSFEDLKLVLTRLHDNCHCAFIGHSGQRDNRKCDREQAFEMYIDHLCKKPFAKQVQLKINHRGDISQWADALMQNNKGEYYVDK